MSAFLVPNSLFSAFLYRFLPPPFLRFILLLFYLASWVECFGEALHFCFWDQGFKAYITVAETVEVQMWPKGQPLLKKEPNPSRQESWIPVPALPQISRVSWASPFPSQEPLIHLRQTGGMWTSWGLAPGAPCTRQPPIRIMPASFRRQIWPPAGVVLAPTSTHISQKPCSWISFCTREPVSHGDTVAWRQGSACCPSWESGGQKHSQVPVQGSGVDWLNTWSLPLDCLGSDPGPYCATLDKLLDLSPSHYPIKWGKYRYLTSWGCWGLNELMI